MRHAEIAGPERQRKGVTGGGSTIVVTEQDIAADTQVEIGSVIEVTFHDTTVLD